jgi:hypothetical protein
LSPDSLSPSGVKFAVAGFALNIFNAPVRGFREGVGVLVAEVVEDAESRTPNYVLLCLKKTFPRSYVLGTRRKRD